jgi:pimeloyl-[acyl-carrier protein] methyl ester esterase
MLHTESAGAGPELVMLHGWGMNLRVFDGLAAQLQSDYRVIRVDLPGHGRSAWHEGMDRAAFLGAVREIVPAGALLCGWSLGGQLALELAADAALGIRALALLHTTPRFQWAPDWPWGMKPEVIAAFAQHLELNYERTVADFLSLQVRGSADAEAVLKTLKRALLEHGAADPRALRFGLQWLADEDLRALCPLLAMPALVVAGQYDRVTPPGAQHALAAALGTSVALAHRHVRLLEIRRAGHASFLSHPAELLAALREFLREFATRGVAA